MDHDPAVAAAATRRLVVRLGRVAPGRDVLRQVAQRFLRGVAIGAVQLLERRLAGGHGIGASAGGGGDVVHSRGRSGAATTAAATTTARRYMHHLRIREL